VIRMAGFIPLPNMEQAVRPVAAIRQTMTLGKA
jgi:hypothetical protein